METFNNPKVAPGLRQSWYPWPYVEGLTMAEATNELAFLATGAYGHPMSKQHGAPLRLAVPWKYGFKSIKSIVRFSFVDKQPKGMWEALQPSEYGFWANVNPAVPHPRWSQASEEVIGTGERRPTLHLQRLRRIRRRHLQGPRQRTPLGLSAPSATQPPLLCGRKRDGGSCARFFRLRDCRIEPVRYVLHRPPTSRI